MSVVTSQPPTCVEAVRQFNRFYTRKIGVLSERLLDSPYSLTEVRVLFELAHRPSLTATELIAELDLDAGYLSRMLARFLRDRLIVRRRSAADGRRAHVHLTKRGQRVFAELDDRSSRQVHGFIAHLPPTEQQRLVDLMKSVRHVLSAPPAEPPAVTLRAPRSGDFGWVVQRHGALYASEYGWDQKFEALVARIVADFIEDNDPARERCWVAEIAGHPVGCVFLAKKNATVAKLRLLLVEPSARGRGVGRRLVEACVDFAHKAGYRRIELWTNSVLHAARHIYEQAGFKLVRSNPHHSFGHDLVGETWALKLPPRTRRQHAHARRDEGGGNVASRAAASPMSGTAGKRCEYPRRATPALRAP